MIGNYITGCNSIDVINQAISIPAERIELKDGRVFAITDWNANVPNDGIVTVTMTAEVIINKKVV